MATGGYGDGNYGQGGYGSVGAVNASGWMGLYSILVTDRKLADEEQRRREIPVSCPIDFVALDRREDGAVNCPMGHFRRE